VKQSSHRNAPEDSPSLGIFPVGSDPTGVLCTELISAGNDLPGGGGGVGGGGATDRNGDIIPGHRVLAVRNHSDILGCRGGGALQCGHSVLFPGPFRHEDPAFRTVSGSGSCATRIPLRASPAWTVGKFDEGIQLVLCPGPCWWRLDATSPDCENKQPRVYSGGVELQPSSQRTWIRCFYRNGQLSMLRERWPRVDFPSSPSSRSCVESVIKTSPNAS